MAAWFLLRVTALMAVHASRHGLAQHRPVARSLLAAAGCMAARDHSDALSGDFSGMSGRGGTHALTPEPAEHAGNSSGHAAGAGWGEGGGAAVGNTGGTSGDPGGPGGAPPTEPPDLPREPQVAPTDVVPGCIDKGATTLFLSADDSSSQASPVVVRSLIAAGRYAPREAISTFECRGEEVSSSPNVVRPQNLAPSDQMIFHPPIGTCSSGVFSREEELGFTVPYTDPLTGARRGVSRAASTCGLRTSWPPTPGEKLTLALSIHDEGDAIYSWTVPFAHFAFHPCPAWA